MTRATPHRLHATAVIVGEYGVLIRGASGAGKSRVALALIAEAEGHGGFARLIGDDRIELAVANGRALVRPHAAIAGMIEERGVGLLALPHEPVGMLSGVIDIVETSAITAIESRYPEEAATFVEIAGVRLPRLVLLSPAGPDECARRILAFLHRVGSPINL